VIGDEKQLASVFEPSGATLEQGTVHLIHFSLELHSLIGKSLSAEQSEERTTITNSYYKNMFQFIKKGFVKYKNQFEQLFTCLGMKVEQV